jgi:hypothetical protein
MPYAAMVTKLSGIANQPCASHAINVGFICILNSGIALTDISIHLRLETIESPRNAYSPVSATLNEVMAVQPARLFVQGKHVDLVNSLNVK